MGYHGSRIVSDDKVDFSDFSESFTENPWDPAGNGTDPSHPEDEDNGIFDKIVEFFQQLLEFFKNLFN